MIMYAHIIVLLAHQWDIHTTYVYIYIYGSISSQSLQIVQLTAHVNQQLHMKPFLFRSEGFVGETYDLSVSSILDVPTKLQYILLYIQVT